MNRFAADASDAWPSGVITRASSKPLSSASDFWNAMFTYPPTILPRAGNASSALRRQVEVMTRTPFSMSM